MEYRLDLNTLLLMLKQSAGTLQAELQNVPKVKGRCQVFIRVEYGSIISCSIKSERGSEVMAGESAVKFLQTMVLEWHYTEQRSNPEMSQTGVLRRTSPPGQHSPIPHRTYSIPQSEFMSWPRLYRTVYSLIDGKSSVHYLVNLLGREQGTEQVFEVINRLQERGFIILERNT